MHCGGSHSLECFRRPSCKPDCLGTVHQGGEVPNPCPQLLPQGTHHQNHVQVQPHVLNKVIVILTSPRILQQFPLSRLFGYLPQLVSRKSSCEKRLGISPLFMILLTSSRTKPLRIWDSLTTITTPVPLPDCRTWGQWKAESHAIGLLH